MEHETCPPKADPPSAENIPLFVSRFMLHDSCFMIVKGTIDRLEEDFAVIFLSNDRRVDWPITALPDDLGEGDAITFAINEDATEIEDRETLAREMLNQILK